MTRLAYGLIWLFIFVVAWENTVTIRGVGTVARLVGVAAAAVGGGVAIAKFNLRSCGFLKFGLLFVAWSWTSIFWSLDTDAAYQRAFTYSQLWVMAWLVFQYADTPDRISGLFSAYVLGSWITAGLTVWNHAHGTEVDSGRYAAEGFNPNDLCVYLNIAILSAVFLGLRATGSAGRIFYWAFVPVALFAVLLAASRQGALGAAVALSFALWSYDQLAGKWRVATALFLALGIVWVVSRVPDTSYDRIATIGAEVSRGTLNERTTIWRAGLQLFVDHPFLGVGAGAFLNAVRPALGYSIPPHNVFLAVAAEGGIVGFSLWCAMLVSSFVPACLFTWRNQRFWQVMFAVLFLAFLSTNFEWRKVTWLVLTLAVSDRLAETRPEIEHQNV